MKKNEKHVLYNALCNNYRYYNISDLEFLMEIKTSYNKIVNNSENRPDLYLELKDKIIIIEEFEFDSSIQFSNGGSFNKQAENFKDKKFIDLIKNKNLDQVNVVMHSSISLESSYEYYIENLLLKFRSHYNSIDKYKEFIKEKTKSVKKIEIVFLITDNTPLGNYIDIEGIPIQINIFDNIEFIKELEQSTKLDYIIFSYGNSNDPIIIIKNTSEQIGVLKKDIKKMGGAL